MSRFNSNILVFHSFPVFQEDFVCFQLMTEINNHQRHTCTHSTKTHEPKQNELRWLSIITAETLFSIDGTKIKNNNWSDTHGPITGYYEF